MRMDIADLRLFLAIAEAGSITAGATQANLALGSASERLRTDQAELHQAATELSGEQQEFMAEIASAQEEASLAAIELLRAIGSPHATAALQEHLPFSSPRLTAAALQALAAIGGKSAKAILQPYLTDGEPQVRVAAITGLRQLGDTTLRQHIAGLLDDPHVQVRAAVLAIILANATAPEYGRARQMWEDMLDAEDKTTQIAALSILATRPDTPLQGRVYRLLHHSDVEVRREALRVLRHLAAARLQQRRPARNHAEGSGYAGCEQPVAGVAEGV